jgi:predicted phage terminase large subunit-like protein
MCPIVTNHPDYPENSPNQDGLDEDLGGIEDDEEPEGAEEWLGWEDAQEEEPLEPNLDAVEQLLEECGQDGKPVRHKTGRGSAFAGKYDTEEGEWSINEQRMLRHLLLHDHLAFTRYFLKKRDSQKFIRSAHHKVMANALDQVLLGNITRLIINVPPGYTKTEMAVISFIARGLAINPRSKFIHISYADQLALLNSSVIKDLCTSEEYNQLFPMTLKVDAKAKGAWYNQYNGGMLAVSAGGMITGFRAGRMMEAFSGAMIIDDPIKPDDAYSEVVRTKVNNRFTNTFKSRLAHEAIPIIVIMQRIHEEDPTGFLLKGGTGEKWHHLILPVEIKPEAEREPYPKEYTHGIPLEYDLEPGPLWEYKHTLDTILTMRTSDPYTTAAQYDQRPSPLGGGMFKDEWWQYYDVAPVCEYRFITADTASKTKEQNDRSCFQCWGYKDGNIYLLDLLKGKWEAPELRNNFRAFWRKHFGTGTQTVNRLRYAAIEDKSSGTGLIQDAAEQLDVPKESRQVIPIIPIQRNKDKVTRAMDMIPYIASKRVYLDRKAEYLSDYLDEHRKFTPLMTHKYDDQIDPTLDAIDQALRPAENQGGTW